MHRQKLSPSAGRAEVTASNEQAHGTTVRRRTLSCGCLVYRTGPSGPEVLLVKPRTKKSTWGVPKGHVHERESPHACAVRETLEETGLLAVVEEELPFTRTESFNEDKTVRVFLARPVEPSFVPFVADSENVDVRWHPIDDLPPLHAYQVSVVAAALPKIRARLAA
jgi:8-oxo-dGTP pyrophosphatase MutT (NUDIX family)